ncbi:MAG: hypothetical protein JEY97_05085 [Bacteroidales bacterium]|nr:hypothetical protein [Bacteroidales bacterium]
MLTKTQVYSTVDKLPENFSIDQLIDSLLFIEKVEKGLKQSEMGLVNNKEKAKDKLSKWLK